MTSEEAIKELKLVAEMYGHNWIKDACAVAVEVLEKQIPKKPIVDKYRCKCANDHNLPVQCRKGKMKYCPMCGQAIDWSEIENDE